MEKQAKEIFKALNNPVRMEILHWLKTPYEHFELKDHKVDPEKIGVCVSCIQERAGLSQSTVSLYLANLQRAGLVTSQRIGPWTYYKRDEETIQKFYSFLKEILL
ncbi:ArsR/SmtB family transcription factor [Entomobacter blattae]|uniref:Helix-turn-helix domain protein n=1 Tax=Entomobacter blattae TaxID=2762277 RepID=A0A7H1NUC0_9PROT|nr:helix-turn-helix transcriptional regulator [Entomobacter blattae]QNT79380.1 Helix-turn-helix domain protein [Entomobacter blattae]